MRLRACAVLAFASMMPLVACEPSRSAVEPAVIVAVPVASSAPPPPRRVAPVAVASAFPEQGGEPLPETLTPLPGGDANVGQSAPGFTRDEVVAQARKVTLRKGNVTVLYFWATWCEPCKKAFPPLEKLYKSKRDAGLTVIGVSVDDDATDLADFAKKYGATFPITWDDGHKIAELYRLQTMPTTLVIDRTGIIRFEHPGWHEGEEGTIATEAKSLL